MMDLRLEDKEVLQHLCSKNCWSYGIFWRVNLENPRFLEVEQVYSEEQIKMLIDSTVQHVHMRGEGIIGEALITGNHHWISADTYDGEWSPPVDNQNVFQAFQGNAQIHLQLSSGIKTIAIIPVAPIGVVQFGSLDKIVEKPDFVNQIRSLFRQPENAESSLFSRNAQGSNNEIYHRSGPGKAPSLNNETCHLSSADSSAPEGSDYWKDKARDRGCSDNVTGRTQTAIIPPHSSTLPEELQSGSLTSIIDTSFRNLKKQFEASNTARAIPLPHGPQIFPASNYVIGSGSRYPTLSAWASNLTAFERELVSSRGQEENLNTLRQNPNGVSCISTFQNFRRELPLNCTNSHLEVNRLGADVLKGPTSLQSYPGNSSDNYAPQKINDPYELHNRLIERVIENPPPTFVASNPSNLGLSNALSGIPPNDANNALQRLSINRRNSPALVGDVDPGTSTSLTQLFSHADPFDSLGLTSDNNQEIENYEDIILPLGSRSQSSGTSEGILTLDAGSVSDHQKAFISEFGLEQLLHGVTSRPSSDNQLSNRPVTGIGNASTYSNQVFPSLGGNGVGFNKPSTENHPFTTAVTGAGTISTYRDQVRIVDLPSLGGEDGFHSSSLQNHVSTVPVTGTGNALAYNNQVQVVDLPSLGESNGFNRLNSENLLSTIPITGAESALTNSNKVHLVGLPSLSETADGFGKLSSETHFFTTPVPSISNESTYINQVEMDNRCSTSGCWDGFNRPSLGKHLVTTPVTVAGSASIYSNQIQIAGLPSIDGNIDGFNIETSENHLVPTSITGARFATTYSNQVHMDALPSLVQTGDTLNIPSSFTTIVTGPGNVSAYCNQVQMGDHPSTGRKRDGVNRPSSENHLFTAAATGLRVPMTYHNQVELVDGAGDGVMPNCNLQRTTMHGNSLQTSQPGVWTGDSCSRGSLVKTQPKKSDEPPKTNKKRARPGEGSRPRPKDRQLIQDRLKELRELIPHGIKCSIDGLLEHSVKYTIFLESIVKYAESLKKNDDPKMTSNASGVFMKDKSSSNGIGATWAFEVGADNIFCPVRVEDLNGAGLLLIEMLCEYSDVLEIVDIFRKFGLTIINGITERVENKTWLRYLVEVKNDVSRMDIFLSLVQFIQEQKPGDLKSDDQASNIAERAIAVSNCQQSSVPLTTGLPDRFQ